MGPGAGSPSAPDDQVVPRPAATAMLVRDGAHSTSPLEVLMVRRNLRADFVGGAHVFPGGGVDSADAGPEAEARARGRTDAEASEILGMEHGGLAYWVAVLRECFEEAGILLACGPGADDLLSFDGALEAERFALLRQDVNAGRRRFLDVCREEGLTLAVDRVHYFAHWITPEGAPRRYDTRFFVAQAPPGQVPAHDAGETIDAEWLRPAVALSRHRSGEIDLIFPTISNLQAIGRFATSDELLSAAAVAGRVPAILPKVVVDGRAVRILLPGDEGYEAATGAPTGSFEAPVGDFDAAVRAVSSAANPPEPPPDSD